MEKNISKLRKAFPHADYDDIREFARHDWDPCESDATNLQVFQMGWNIYANIPAHTRDWSVQGGGVSAGYIY